MAAERVLYLLGAGFSAPLGLPVMSNFLLKSKDQYAEQSEAVPYFQEVFQLVDRLSKTKNFYETDLFNIEEILSLLEMGAHLRGRRLRQTFLKYLCAVVQYYTPEMRQPQAERLLNNNWYADALGDGTMGRYGLFGACLLNARIVRHQTGTTPGPWGRFTVDRQEAPATRYSVVTLNYDRVLEAIPEAIGSWYHGALAFAATGAEPDPQWERGPYLAKLHGSVHDGEIVPPTWSKGVSTKVVAAWQLAYRLLAEATQIRIIGYSLPVADAYVKYLLRSAAMKSERLKRFDVICLDPDGSVETRYREFVRFPNFRFFASNCMDYLIDLKQAPLGYSSATETLAFDGLEQAHRTFVMSQPPSQRPA